jgi:glycosyltransferase involved in cell wall biosynthesis
VIIKKRKLVRISTVPKTINALLKGQIKFLNQYYEVIVISSPDMELAEINIREGVPVIPLFMYRRYSPLQDIISIFKMWLLFRKIKPDIVHSMTPKAGFVSMIAAKIAGVPHRLHTFTGLIFPTSGGIKKYILMGADWLTCYCATMIIPEGNGVKNDLVGAGITDKHLEVIKYGNVNGVDLDFYSVTDEIIARAKDIRIQYHIEENDTVFLFVGRIVKDKGIYELIKAFTSLDNDHMHLMLAGNFEDKLDPISPQIRQLINENKRIHLLGFVKDVRDVLKASDIFILPSYREGFPNVVLQACAMLVPCIVTDINGSNEIIIDNYNGLVVPPKDVQKLKSAMLLLANDKSKRNEFSLLSRIIVESKYEQKLLWDAILKVYNELN